MTVFVSHSFQDKSKYDDICYAFEERSIPHWKPNEIVAGQSLREKLRDAIKNCTVCVFIATRNSLESGWCQAEIGAFWGAGKPVVTYLADDHLTEPDLPKQFQGDKWASSIREVVAAVKLYLGEVAQDERETPTLVGQMTIGAFVELLGTIRGEKRKQPVDVTLRDLKQVLERFIEQPRGGLIVRFRRTADLSGVLTPQLSNLIGTPTELLKSVGKGPWPHRFGVRTSTGTWTAYALEESHVSGVDGYVGCALLHEEKEIITAAAVVGFIVDSERSPTGLHFGELLCHVGTPVLGELTHFPY